jgi:hypothetical protein
MVQSCQCAISTHSSLRVASQSDHTQRTQGPLLLSRRALLPSVVWTSTWVLQPGASAEDISIEAARARFFGGASVVPALGVPEYVDRITSAWPVALQEFQKYIEEGQYKELSESLFLSPFDDVRQAAFYIPYALAQEDVAAAFQSRSAYDAFLNDVKNVYATAQAVAAYQGEEQDVEAALLSLSSSLQTFLANVK